MTLKPHSSHMVMMISRMAWSSSTTIHVSLPLVLPIPACLKVRAARRTDHLDAVSLDFTTTGEAGNQPLILSFGAVFCAAEQGCEVCLGDIVQRVDDVVCPVQRAAVVRRGDGKAGHTRCAGRPHAVERVLDDDAPFAGRAEALG